jgi:hypothetical protein
MTFISFRELERGFRGTREQQHRQPMPALFERVNNLGAYSLPRPSLWGRIHEPTIQAKDGGTDEGMNAVRDRSEAKVAPPQ